MSDRDRDGDRDQPGGGGPDGHARVVLLDPAGGLEPVREALVDHPAVSVERARALPAGEGVIALLVPPEIRVDASVLTVLPDLRIVAATSAGFEQLDLDALAAARVWATHCPGYCSEEVAEHAVAFAVDLLRGITLLDRHVHAGGWSLHVSAPRRVSGTVLGIVGLGRIGREVARRARALGMEVVGHDPAIAGDAVDGTPLRTLDELLSAAEVVTVHAPAAVGAPPLLGAAELAALRPGSYLVNCARAGLVDRDALAAALHSGHLGGCALDVLATEPPGRDAAELTWPRTILNPHAAWYSPAAATTPYRRGGEAVAAVLSGAAPRDALVTPG